MISARAQSLSIRTKGDVTRDDLQRRLLAQHRVPILEQYCSHSKQFNNNVVKTCCAKKCHCESSSVTSPLRSNDLRTLVLSTLILIAQILPQGKLSLSRLVGTFRTSPPILFFSALANWRDRRKSDRGFENAWRSRFLFLICCPDKSLLTQVAS